MLLKVNDIVYTVFALGTIYNKYNCTLHYVIMQVFWAYIVGMLTSLGKMKLDRIHSMLKMFALQGTGGKECSQVRSLNQN